MKNKDEIIRKHITEIVSIEHLGGCTYVVTKNRLVRASFLELLKSELGCHEIMVTIKNLTGELTYIFE